jgi:dTDP-4-amino-4,6-dideoxygalactose transaminase
VSAPHRSAGAIGVTGGLAAYLDVAALTPPVPHRSAVLATVRALGLSPGARVAVPVWGCPGVAEVLSRSRYELVPLDVDPGTGRLDVSTLARTHHEFELLWMADVDGLPPEGAQLAALARRRDVMVVEEMRESLGAVSQGLNPGSHADAVLLHGPDRRVRVGSVSAETVAEVRRALAARHAPAGWDATRRDEVLEQALAALPARLAGQRRLAALWESAWGPLELLGLPDYPRGTRGTWPRYTVRVLGSGATYPNAAWARWLRARGVRATCPALRLAQGLDPDDPHVTRGYPGAVEYLRRALSFSCEATVTLQEAERTVCTLDELARREAA